MLGWCQSPNRGQLPDRELLKLGRLPGLAGQKMVEIFVETTARQRAPHGPMAPPSRTQWGWAAGRFCQARKASGHG